MLSKLPAALSPSVAPVDTPAIPIARLGSRPTVSPIAYPHSCTGVYRSTKMTTAMLLKISMSTVVLTAVEIAGPHSPVRPHSARSSPVPPARSRSCSRVPATVRNANTRPPSSNVPNPSPSRTDIGCPSSLVAWDP